MKEHRLFIGELAKRAGLRPRTVRYYEAVGLLPPAQRGENRYRLYSKETVELLQFIAKAKALSFTLSEIREIVGIRQQGREPCPHVRTLVEQKVAYFDQLLANLITLRKRLRWVLAGWKVREKRHTSTAVVCPHMESEPLLRAPRRKT